MTELLLTTINLKQLWTDAYYRIRVFCSLIGPTTHSTIRIPQCLINRGSHTSQSVLLIVTYGPIIQLKAFFESVLTDERRPVKRLMSVKRIFRHPLITGWVLDYHIYCLYLCRYYSYSMHELLLVLLFECTVQEDCTVLIYGLCACYYGRNFHDGRRVTDNRRYHSDGSHRVTIFDETVGVGPSITAN